MPVDVSQLKQRIAEVLDAKTDLKRLTSKTYETLSGDEKFAIRYNVIVLAEALGSICVHIAIEDLGQAPGSFSGCFELLDEKGICVTCAEDLSGIIKLRVYDSVKNGFYAVDKFLEAVEEKYAIDL
jgi:uncharacterized protein YutE (UPF0331/DUF86 family)